VFVFGQRVIPAGGDYVLLMQFEPAIPKVEGEMSRKVDQIDKQTTDRIAAALDQMDHPTRSSVRLPWLFNARTRLAWFIMRSAKWFATGIAPWLS